MAGAIPPQVQNQLMQLQQLQQQAQVVVAQRQQLEVTLRELERTLEELRKTGEDTPVYKSVGAIMLRVQDRKQLEAQLEEEKETADVRLQSLKRQEEKVRERLTSLQKELEAALGRMG